MPDPAFDIRHGTLVDVIGSPIRHNATTLVPAIVELSGSGFSPDHKFAEWCAKTGHRAASTTVIDEDAPWILGRLIYLFNAENTPEDDRGEKCCFHLSFIAILHDHSNIAVPFDCSDFYGRTALWFSSDDEPPEDLRAEIADALYELLLDSPDSIADYDNRMYHSGAGCWARFGVSMGQPYMDSDD